MIWQVVSTGKVRLCELENGDYDVDDFLKLLTTLEIQEAISTVTMEDEEGKTK